MLISLFDKQPLRTIALRECRGGNGGTWTGGASGQREPTMPPILDQRPPYAHVAMPRVTFVPYAHGARPDMALLANISVKQGKKQMDCKR
jgi:hypothetical protein